MSEAGSEVVIHTHRFNWRGARAAWPWWVLTIYLAWIALTALGWIARDWALVPAQNTVFGVNSLGQSIAARLSQALLQLAIDVFPGAALALATGTLIGALAALWRSAGLMALCDVIDSLPSYLLLVALAIAARTWPGGIWLLQAALFWPSVARAVRMQALDIVATPYFDAARLQGMGTWHLLWRVLRPNLNALLAALALICLSNCMKAQLVLGFVGLDSGARPSLGAMMSEGILDALTYQYQTLAAAFIASFALLISFDTLAMRQQMGTPCVTPKPPAGY
jgi:ABC-type dipeptide/oligopeptide/nickel transport system permease subunit